MASIGYSAASASGVFTSSGYLAAVGGGAPTAAQVATSAYVPYIGWAIGIGAALFDAFVLMPSLRGKGRQIAEPPRLLDAPVGSNAAGAARIYAIGGRMRVPTHVLWQTQKVRESVSSSSKAGTTVSQRKVYFDAAVALNDRPTLRLQQLIGNGKLMLYSTRNIYGITTNRMSLSIVAGRVRLTAQTTLDPDFSLLFQVNDAVELRDWSQTAGSNLNTGYWKVLAVEPHTTTQSYIELGPYSGQTVAGIVATAGNAFAPATIRRVDNVLFAEGGIVQSTVGTLVPVIGYRATNSTNWRIPGLFAMEDKLIVQNAGALTGTLVKRAAPNDSGFSGGFKRRTGGGTAPIGDGTYGASATNPGRITFEADTGFTTGIFPTAFVPTDYFASGTETQGASALIVADQGSGNVPGYRGVAYQGLDDFFATQFGDSLPYSMEAIIDVDQSMDWGRAISTILTERCDIPATAIDVEGITQRPFLGAYLRGPVPAITALQPILLAGQLLVQDRDGVLVFSEFGNADEVQLENGAAFSDFGTRLDGDAAADDKWTVEDMATEDLPTKIGVRHQDPDNQYADGYQFFGLRNPEGVDHTNEQEVDLAQMVLTRQEAATLSAVLLRRAWVNRRKYRFTLPASYLHLLEADLLTWTDDDNVPHVARIVQRDIGSDFRVSVTCIAEDLDLATYVGSPVQTGAGNGPLAIPGPAALDVVVVDAPAATEGTNDRPGVHIAVGHSGGPWSGAAIYESVDGTTYDLVDIVGKRSVTGTLETQLGTGVSADRLTDFSPIINSQTVEVQFSPYGATQINSRTDREVAAGANWCALIRPDGKVELAAFTTATALGGGVFELGGWFRGLRGTFSTVDPTLARNDCDAHAAGTRLVLLNGDTYWREFTGEITPAAVSYKVVPAGLGLDDVEPVLHVTQRRNALPLPVRQFDKTIGGSPFDARFEVVHNWCRTLLPIGAQPPHPMDEEVEAYRFTIYSPDGTQVRRTKTISAAGTGTPTLRDRWVDYPASEQSADGYTPSGSTLFWVDCQQIGKYGLSPTVKRNY